MRRRLVLSYLSVVAVILIVLEIPLGVLTDHHERDLLGSSAAEQATGLAVLAGQDLIDTHDASLAQLVQRYRLETSGQVLIVNAAGNELADSDSDGGQDLAQLRPWIDAALSGRTVTAQRHDGRRPVTLAAVPITNPSTTATSAGSSGAVVLSLPAGATLALIHRVWLALLGFAVVVLALTVLIGLRVARSVTSPLAALEAAVSHLGDGHLSERAEPAGPPELRNLALEFNRMAARMEDLVTAQSRFVADASHQLRSPLTALRLGLENLQESSPASIAPSVGALEREVQRLSRLVDGLLTLSRADGDRPQRGPVDVVAVIDERVETWSPLAHERGVHLCAQPGRARDPYVPLVAGDLDQILDNLLANALDVTPQGRSITVEVDETEHAVEVVVADEGPGMSEAERARAFDRFWQGPGHKGGSSGLGLAIVRQLARRNGAEVELAADGESGGLRAEVHLTR